MRIPFLICAFISSFILFSCKKKKPSPVTPSASDTLSAGWKKIIIASGANVSDVFFINSTGFASTDHGIFKSTDGGNNWSQINSSQTGIINIGMGNQSNIIFVTITNQIIVSHDGGTTLNTVPVIEKFIDVFFVNSTTAYAAGNSFWKTTDAGDHWTKISDFSPTTAYCTLHFLNDQTGWIARSDGIYKTTNGGTNWQLINTRQGFVVFFNSVNHGCFSDVNNIWVTFDGGITWSRANANDTGYMDIHFISDNIGYCTNASRIYKTIDGGINWTREVGLASVGNNGLVELHFTDANHGWACGGNGIILIYAP